MQVARLEKKLLHYTGLAIERFRMIREGDRVALALSGGKDSLAMVRLMHLIQKRAKIRFLMRVVLVRTNWPGVNTGALIDYLEKERYDYEIIPSQIAETVTEQLNAAQNDPKIRTRPACMLCSRLRRGALYKWCETNHFTTLALGHHRDDLIISLLMSLFFGGSISSMPPKLLNQTGKILLIRPLVYCQEKDLASYAQLLNLPVQANQCGFTEQNHRTWLNQELDRLAATNPKIRANLLHALENLHPSQLMDRRAFNFADLAPRSE